MYVCMYMYLNKSAVSLIGVVMCMCVFYKHCLCARVYKLQKCSRMYSSCLAFCNNHSMRTSMYAGIQHVCEVDYIYIIITKNIPGSDAGSFSAVFFDAYMYVFMHVVFSMFEYIPGTDAGSFSHSVQTLFECI
jgi:hypothetical protein